MVEAYPLTWPAGKIRTPKGDKKRASFKDGVKEYRQWSDGTNHLYRSTKQVSVASAVDRLMTEFQRFNRPKFRINLEDVVVSTNVRVKLDGMPYSNQREPEDSGVAVYFILDKIQYCFPCDKWDRVADNIAAVANHLDAMRGMERWGVGELNDAFTGYKALPGGDVQLSFWEILEIQPSRDVDFIKAQYRNLAFRRHPDHGGTNEQFNQLQTAYEQALKYANQ